LVYIDGKVYPVNDVTNEVRNQKYTLSNFVPTVLYNQFKYFFNFFFLMITVSQLIPPLKVGFLFSYLAPLAFVLMLTMLNEASDYYKRYKRDLEINTQTYIAWRQSGREDIQSKDIKVGDLIEVSINKRVPADLIVLYCYDDRDSVFIRTDQLDGETD